MVCTVDTQPISADLLLIKSINLLNQHTSGAQVLSYGIYILRENQTSVCRHISVPVQDLDPEAL